MKFFSIVFLYILIFSSCTNQKVVKEPFSLQDAKGYYSDYFVFIADDGGSPLVVPIDINWSLFENGYEPEFKSWYGTETDWPIAYFKDKVAAKVSDFPQEAFEHNDTKQFIFDQANRSIISRIDGAPEIRFQIPNKDQWVLSNIESDFPTYAFQTEILMDNESRSGWMIYERIRFEEQREFNGFEAFFWMPIVVNGNLYHFTQHRGEQTAVKWSVEQDNIKTETLSGFSFKVLETIADTKSKRKEIPKTVHLRAPDWELDIILKSTGEQVGYGEAHPKGLAYFRQSLLQSSPQSKDSGYGMMELILANN